MLERDSEGEVGDSVDREAMPYIILWSGLRIKVYDPENTSATISRTKRRLVWRGKRIKVGGGGEVGERVRVSVRQWNECGLKKFGVFTKLIKAIPLPCELSKLSNGDKAEFISLLIMNRMFRCPHLCRLRPIYEVLPRTSKFTNSTHRVHL